MAKSLSGDVLPAGVVVLQVKGIVSAKYSSSKDATTLAVYDKQLQKTKKIWVKGRVEDDFGDAPVTVECEVTLPDFVFMAEGSSLRLVD